MIAAISMPYVLDGNKVVIGTSVGIALSPRDGLDPHHLMRCADMALYSAKADGRGCYRFFEPEMELRVQAHRELELDFREAVADGEFRVYYQAQINLATRSLSGFEALVRWAHPQRGTVSPTDFIPLAEETGLIVPLGLWVLQRACADAMTWPGSAKVAVNLSPVQLSSPTLVDDVAAALTSSGLDPRRLELEITETAILADTDNVIVVLHRLRDLGLSIALDDFGTGYSSLSHLRRFPFSKVKIDRSFVDGLGRGSDSEVIVAALVDLCQRLGLKTTAEGIETTTQLQRLLEMSCTEGQGYLFSRPCPGELVAGLVDSLCWPGTAEALGGRDRIGRPATRAGGRQFTPQVDKARKTGSDHMPFAPIEAEYEP